MLEHRHFHAAFTLTRQWRRTPAFITQRLLACLYRPNGSDPNSASRSSADCHLTDRARTLDLWTSLTLQLDRLWQSRSCSHLLLFCFYTVSSHVYLLYMTTTLLAWCTQPVSARYHARRRADMHKAVRLWRRLRAPRNDAPRSQRHGLPSPSRSAILLVALHLLVALYLSAV